LPARARDGSGILLGNGEGSKHASTRRNEPKDTVDSPVTSGAAKRSHWAGAMIKGMKGRIDIRPEGMRGQALSGRGSH